MRMSDLYRPPLTGTPRRHDARRQAVQQPLLPARALPGQTETESGEAAGETLRGEQDEGAAGSTGGLRQTWPDVRGQRTREWQVEIQDDQRESAGGEDQFAALETVLHRARTRPQDMRQIGTGR